MVTFQENLNLNILLLMFDINILQHLVKIRYTFFHVKTSSNFKNYIVSSMSRHFFRTLM